MKKSILKSLIITITLLLVLSSCSLSKNEAAEDRGEIMYDSSLNFGSADGYTEEAAPESSIKGSTGSLINTSTNTTEAPANTNRKIIENIRISAQTREFDNLLSNLNSQISALEGYIESSNVSGREIGSTRNRTAEFIVRIPCQNTTSFTDFISENSVMTNKSISTQDVTLTYVDMESRVAALESEKAALEKLLDSATTMKDIVDIRDKLTDVIYEIESYKSKLRTYDNLVDYNTVTIHIYEVERTAIVEEQTVFQKIGSNLKTNFEDVWNGIVNIFIFIISAIPYLIPLSIIIVVTVTVVRLKINRRKAAKKNTDE